MQPPQPPEYPIVLINLETGEGFDFIFPEEIGLQASANWKPQDVTHSTKPLIYGNNEPEEISLSQVWLEAAEDESLSPKIVQLVGLTKKIAGRGAPPALLLSWGDSSFLCVLTEAQVTEQFFDRDGKPRRASVSLKLLELQETDQAESAQSSPQQQVSPSDFIRPQTSQEFYADVLRGPHESVFGREP